MRGLKKIFQARRKRDAGVRKEDDTDEHSSPSLTLQGEGIASLVRPQTGFISARAGHEGRIAPEVREAARRNVARSLGNHPREVCGTVSPGKRAGAGLMAIRDSEAGVSRARAPCERNRQERRQGGGMQRRNCRRNCIARSGAHFGDDCSFMSRSRPTRLCDINYGRDVRHSVPW